MFSILYFSSSWQLWRPSLGKRTYYWLPYAIPAKPCYNQFPLILKTHTNKPLVKVKHTIVYSIIFLLFLGASRRPILLYSSNFRQLLLLIHLCIFCECTSRTFYYIFTQLTLTSIFSHLSSHYENFIHSLFSQNTSSIFCYVFTLSRFLSIFSLVRVITLK